MFGFTKLTPEEQAEYKRKQRIKELEEALCAEMRMRSKSLEKSKILQDELEKIL